MTTYFSTFEHPCPRCGGTVDATFTNGEFIHLTIKCDTCGNEDFTPQERGALGKQIPYSL